MDEEQLAYEKWQVEQYANNLHSAAENMSRTIDKLHQENENLEQRAAELEAHLRAVLEQVVQSVDDGSRFVSGDVVDAAAKALEGK